MKPVYIFQLGLVIATSLITTGVLAQAGAVEHMSALSQREEMLSQDYLSYMSTVAHGGRARKMEKRRNELIATIKGSIKEAEKLKPFEGDASLRDAYKDYWTVLLSVFNEEYHKIVDMEEVAEQSYDAMETYLLIQEKAGEKLDEAYGRVALAYKVFAARHNIKLVEGEQTRLSRKLDQAGSVNKYYNQLYLIYFKSTVQEGMMMIALNKNDINAIEQGRSSMSRYATEGLSRLDTTRAFQGDGSVIATCRKVLAFQKSEAEQFPVITNFMIRNEEFTKIKKTFDTKPAGKRTQADVDQYNKAVKDLNTAVNDYNKVNDQLNKDRTKMHEQWDNTTKRFFDSHVPHK
jgi:uncharacterized protein YpuA (DUF1002 family)